MRTGPSVGPQTMLNVGGKRFVCEDCGANVAPLCFTCDPEQEVATDWCDVCSKYPCACERSRGGPNHGATTSNGTTSSTSYRDMRAHESALAKRRKEQT